jgi:hypothetical protein
MSETKWIDFAIIPYIVNNKLLTIFWVNASDAKLLLDN